MYEKLFGFLSGYLHQYWDLEYDSSAVAAKDFAASEEASDVVAAIGEIEVLLASHGDDQITGVLRQRSVCFRLLRSRTNA